jgi:hypothetical protein
VKKQLFGMALALSVMCLSADADELTLKDGRRISFRVLKDAGDSVEVQTVDNQNMTFKKDDIKDVKLITFKAPLTGATFVGDETKVVDKPINLLAALDLKKNGITGEWRASSGSVVGSGIGLLEIPYIPVTPAYDIEIALERKDGDDEVVIGLVVSGKPFSVTFDWSKGSATGLTCVGGARVYENDTKVSGKQLIVRKPMTVKCAVREGRIVVLVDGKAIIDWKGDMKQLSHPGRTKEQNLFFGIHNTTVAVTKYIFTARQ